MSTVRGMATTDTLHGFRFMVWTDDSGVRFVPDWAPPSVIALASLRHGAKARLTNEEPHGARAWGPWRD